MAETKPGGFYLGTDGKPHDANGTPIVEELKPEGNFTPAEPAVMVETDGTTQKPEPTPEEARAQAKIDAKAKAKADAEAHAKAKEA